MVTSKMGDICAVFELCSFAIFNQPEVVRRIPSDCTSSSPWKMNAAWMHSRASGRTAPEGDEARRCSLATCSAWRPAASRRRRRNPNIPRDGTAVVFLGADVYVRSFRRGARRILKRVACNCALELMPVQRVKELQPPHPLHCCCVHSQQVRASQPTRCDHLRFRRCAPCVHAQHAIGQCPPRRVGHRASIAMRILTEEGCAVGGGVPLALST